MYKKYRKKKCVINLAENLNYINDGNQVSSAPKIHPPFPLLLRPKLRAQHGHHGSTHGILNGKCWRQDWLALSLFLNMNSPLPHSKILSLNFSSGSQWQLKINLRGMRKCTADPWKSSHCNSRSGSWKVCYSRG